MYLKYYGSPIGDRLKFLITTRNSKLNLKVPISFVNDYTIIYLSISIVNAQMSSNADNRKNIDVCYMKYIYKNEEYKRVLHEIHKLYRSSFSTFYVSCKISNYSKRPSLKLQRDDLHKHTNEERVSTSTFSLYQRLRMWTNRNKLLTIPIVLSIT